MSNGAAMVHVFRQAAEREKFLVVAPDSRATPDGKDGWEVGDHAGEVTADYLHIQACVAEVLAMPGVRIDPAHVLIAGHSGGGSTAPYVATNEEPCGRLASNRQACPAPESDGSMPAPRRRLDTAARSVPSSARESRAPPAGERPRSPRRR